MNRHNLESDFPFIFIVFKEGILVLLVAYIKHLVNWRSNQLFQILILEMILET